MERCPRGGGGGRQRSSAGASLSHRPAGQWTGPAQGVWALTAGRNRIHRRRPGAAALGQLALDVAGVSDVRELGRLLLQFAQERTGCPRGLVLAALDGVPGLLATSEPPSQGARLHVPLRSGPIAAVHRSGRTSVVSARAVGTEPAIASALAGAHRVVVVPLRAGERPVGVLIQEVARSGRLPAALRTSLENAGTLIGWALDQRVQLEQAQRLAATDGLTKIANRRTFQQTLEREVGRASRGAGQVSLVLLDIDHFKRLNDTYGHQSGDEVLRNVAAAVACECRDFDTAARYGGEEFAVILPGCAAEEAMVIAERLRCAVSAAPAVVTVTASAGVATYPEHALDPDSLVRAADQALYASKRAGRDRTTACVGPLVGPDPETVLRQLLHRRLDLSASSGPVPDERDYPVSQLAGGAAAVAPGTAREGSRTSMTACTCSGSDI